MIFKQVKGRRSEEQRYNSDLLRGNIDALLLHLINEMGKTYAYHIIKEIEAKSAGYFRLKPGTIYPALHKLEKAGLVFGESQKLPNGRERRYYSMTDKGHDLLRRRLAMWRSFASAMALVMKKVGT